MDFEVTPLANPNFDQPAKSSLWTVLLVHKLKLITGLLGLLALLGGWYYWFGRANFSEARVDFKIDGPGEATAGELIIYKISYQNNNPVALNTVKLNLFYPTDAVVLKDGSITNLTNETIDLGMLAPGASGERDLALYLIGDRGNIKFLKAALLFTPANVQSVFRKELALATTITRLAVPLTLAVPPSVIDGQTVTYLIDYSNQTDQDFANLRLNVKYPDGFRFISAVPAPAGGQASWLITKLKPGSGARISIQGTLTGRERESKPVSVTLQKPITTPAGDMEVNFEKSEASSVIASPLLAVSISVNNSTSYTAHLGDRLEYLITFKNQSQSDLTGLTLTAGLNGSMFDLSTVQSDTFFDSRSNTLAWDQSNLPALALLRPGQSGTAGFNVRLKNNFTGGAPGAGNSLVKTSLHLETPNVPAELDVDRLTADDQLVTRISSEPTFGQTILLNDPQFGASGPYPPRVNQTTQFTVRWRLTNPANALTPATVSAQLAPGVKWENRTRSSNTSVVPAYDSRTGTVKWELGTLPAGAGVTSAYYEADFVIFINPSVNQINQAPSLLKNSRLDATDSVTLEKIARTVQDSDTGSVSDSNQNGSVQP